MSRLKGGFTLPGETGYEELTLKMAEKWGADVKISQNPGVSYEMDGKLVYYSS